MHLVAHQYQVAAFFCHVAVVHTQCNGHFGAGFFYPAQVGQIVYHAAGIGVVVHDAVIKGVLCVHIGGWGLNSVIQQREHVHLQNILRRLGNGQTVLARFAAAGLFGFSAAGTHLQMGENLFGALNNRLG